MQNTASADTKVRGQEKIHNMENNLINRLLVKLADASQLHDSQLDLILEKLKQRLNQAHSTSDALAEIHEAEQYLDKHPLTLAEQLNEGLQQATSAGHGLQNVKGISGKLRNELRDFVTSPNCETVSDYQSYILRILDFYQQALNTKEKNNPDFLREYPQAGDKKAALQDTVTSEKMHNRICDELQRLITELDFVGEYGEQLATIRKQILAGIEPAALPGLCLEVINLIIDGTREERKASQAFLHSLNESLTAFHHGFNYSLSESRALRKDQLDIADDLRAKMKTLGMQVDNTHDLLQLKLSIQSQLTEIGKLLEQKDVLQNREQELESQLVQMEDKLRLMKEETSEYKKRLSAQKHKLFLDSLTQVYNRAALDERLELEYKRWQRYDNPLCLAIVDIDHFKRINDSYGHMAGDKALKVIARALQKALRDTDFIARFGGEEFVLLMPNVDPEQLQIPLEKLKETVKSIPFKFKDNRVSISVSIGATMFKEGDQPLDAFERADQALYEAKNQGRDRIEIKNN